MTDQEKGSLGVKLHKILVTFKKIVDQKTKMGGHQVECKVVKGAFDDKPMQKRGLLTGT